MFSFTFSTSFQPTRKCSKRCATCCNLRPIFVSCVGGQSLKCENGFVVFFSKNLLLSLLIAGLGGEKSLDYSERKTQHDQLAAAGEMLMGKSKTTIQTACSPTTSGAFLTSNFPKMFVLLNLLFKKLFQENEKCLENRPQPFNSSRLYRFVNRLEFGTSLLHTQAKLYCYHDFLFHSRIQDLDEKPLKKQRFTLPDRLRRCITFFRKSKSQNLQQGTLLCPWHRQRE